MIAPTLRRLAPREPALLTAKWRDLEAIPSTNIKILKTVDAVRKWRKPRLLEKRIVGLVPTMGALHEGHLSLIRAAARASHDVVVSIYVNPSQFGVAEDFDSYPMPWEHDCKVLTALDRKIAADASYRGRISAVFAPSTEEMYPSGFPGQEENSNGSFVVMKPICELLEGRSRPTFLRGVATVCMKLFNIVQPEQVFFGQKDVQQSVMIRKMIKDFLLPINVSVIPTSREPDGLARSSRNVFLGERRRKIATVLNRALKAAEHRYLVQGTLSRNELLQSAYAVLTKELEKQNFMDRVLRTSYQVDYISIADPTTMEEVTNVDPKVGAVLSGAIQMNPVTAPQPGEVLGRNSDPAVRLIDNIILNPREGPSLDASPPPKKSEVTQRISKKDAKTES
ncbi:pantoate-beta-alanine ligase-like protein [Nemania diffusa]|nr:pantoate-beta-alanine ligase-like protein [Nemania diffusa]